MKENVLQKLDLLEAQLARIESKGKEEDDETNKAVTASRLARTKYLLERKEKTGSLSTDPEELRRQIEETKHEIVQRKIFYAHNVVKRFLKQFCKVEPMRITKRMQKSDSSKRPALEQEAELVKQADVENWAQEIVNRALAKQFDYGLVTGKPLEKRTLSTPEISVFGRIGKADAVRKAVQQLVESVKAHYTPLNGADPAPIAEPAQKPPQKRPREDAFTVFESESDDNSDDDNDNDNTNEEEPAKPIADPFFDGTVMETAPHYYDDISGSEDEQTPSNYALPMLNQGYISGSEDEGDSFAPDPQPARKNRRGQRARRKIWEQKFGARANHIIKQEREEQKKKEEKEAKKRRREEKERALKRQKIEFEKKPLHPSWEARQREKEKVLKAKPEGKKVKFD